MTFNITKCNILRIAGAREPLSRFYSLSGHVLEEVTEAKYLGVTISNALSWSSHISVTTQKGKVIIAFQGLYCLSKTKEMAYIAIVLSVLEYHAPISDPYLKKDISKIEKLQHLAARFVRGGHQRTSSVTKMLKDLGWTNFG